MMPLPLARARARKLVSEIAGLVERVEIVGSIRRDRPEVRDIELLVQPRLIEGDLFGRLRPDLEPVVKAYSRWGEVLKAGDRWVNIRLGHINAPRAVRPTLDLFIVLPPASWGVLHAIRTGPAELSKLAVTRIRRRGWRCHRGALWAPYLSGPIEQLEGFPIRRGGDDSMMIEAQRYMRLATPREEDFFRAARLVCVPPAERDAQESRRFRPTPERQR